MRGAVLLEQAHELFDKVKRGLVVSFSALSWERPKEPVAVERRTSRKRSKSPAKQGPKLSKVLDDYLKEQKLQGVSEKTIGDKQSVVELLIRIIGDLPLKQIGREQARQFKETALKLPPRLGQLPPKPLEKMIAEAETTISVTTFNNYVKNLTTLFIYALREGYCDTNPFQGLKVQQRVKANEQRSRFTEDDLKRILTFSTC